MILQMFKKWTNRSHPPPRGTIKTRRLRDEV